MKINVWFNKGLSTVYHALQLIRQADADHEFRLFCSHVNPHFAGFLAADEQAIEPDGLNGMDYVEYCLEFCRSNQIAVFFPGRQASLIAHCQSRFSVIGTLIVTVADSEMLSLISDKAAFYRDIANSDLQAVLPTYETINSLTAFETAYARLREQHAVLCIKPAVSIYGLGFKIIDEDSSRFRRLVGGDEFRIGLDELRECLSEGQIFRDLLLMEYLPGAEYSVDCLASEDSLLYAIARRKSAQPGYGQIIEHHPEIHGIVQSLTYRYALRSVFNVQFKTGRDGLKLLEINTRMSGGLPLACLAGVNLPYLALLAVCRHLQPHHLVTQKNGIRVTLLDTALLLAAE